MAMKPLPAVLLALGLAACQTGPTPEELTAVDRTACDQAGFATDSDAHKLCLLLQDTNRRLENLERRISFIELDVRGGVGFGFSRCRFRYC